MVTAIVLCNNVIVPTSAYLDREGERGSEPPLCRKGWGGMCASGKSGVERRFEWEEVGGSLREDG